MAFAFRPAKREQTPLLIGVAGPSGSGKTVSALKLARGIMGGKDEGIFFVDTEAGRAKHYACGPGEQPGPFRFQFQHCDLDAPFSPDRYLEAIDAAVEAGAGVVIVDSMSHAHEGPGGLLEAHEAELQKMAGNDFNKRERVKFTAWIRPKAAHGRFVNAILQKRCHFIFAFRAKDKLVLVKRDGKTEPVSAGWTPICSDRFEYEMTTLLMLPPGARGVPDLSLESTKVNANHGDFFPAGKPIDEECGRKLAEWARGGSAPAAPTKPKADATTAGKVATAKDALTTAEKIEAAKAALAYPDEVWDAIVLAKLKGPLDGAPEEVIEADLLPYLRQLAKKDARALDELAKLMAAGRSVPA